MGLPWLCGQTEEDRQSAMIDQRNKRDNRRENKVFKAVLLGTGESGKSTLLKQVRILYKDGFTAIEKERLRDIIFFNSIESMKKLVQSMDTSTLGSQIQPSIAVLQRVSSHHPISYTVAKHLSCLWNSHVVRKQFARRCQLHLQLPDSAAYFWNNVSRLCKPEYIPTQEDILHARVRTTGIVDLEFSMDHNRFHLVDVGGQRSERRKWIHLLDGVDAVLFVVSLSEFNQVLMEDGCTNRMQEALELFTAIAGMKYFRRSAICLFLNKRDLFEDKIRRGESIRTAFPNYDGPDGDVDSALTYIRSMFVDRFHQQRQGSEQECGGREGSGEREHLVDYTGEPSPMEFSSLSVHVTCATDTQLMHVVFQSVRENIIAASLQLSGLLSYGVSQ